MSYPRLALALVLTAACGSDPPPDAQVATKPADSTEVKMEAVPVTSSTAGAPETPPAAANTPPSTTASSPSADPSEDPNIGGPQEPTVEKAVAPIRPRIRACYKKALAADGKAAGTVTFDTTIGKDGKVKSVRFVKKDALSDDFVNCLTTAMKTMSFPADRKTQVVVFTFGNASGGAKTPTSASADAGTAAH